VTERAMQAVVSGRASPTDAVRHSKTGTVELVTVVHGRAMPERCLLCSRLPHDLRRAADPDLADAA
jgi:hypothetical protein